MKSTRLLLLVVAIGILAVALMLIFTESKKLRVIPLSVGSATIMVEVAETEPARARGLSSHLSLSSERGMLFVFDESGTLPIWMKGMRFPIDIIWIDAGKNVVAMKSNASPGSYLRMFSSDIPARYVLETSSGFAQSL